MVTANSVKFSSVTYKIFPSNTGEPSRSTFNAQMLAFWASISTLLREYDNILCPSLGWNDLSSQAPQKSSLSENFKITFNLVLGHIRFVLMLVLHFAKSRDVTSLLKWVYTCFHTGRESEWHVTPCVSYHNSFFGRHFTAWKKHFSISIEMTLKGKNTRQTSSSGFRR